MNCTCVRPEPAVGQFSALLAAEASKDLAEQDDRPDPLNGLELAITVDDLFLWKGTPWARGYSPYGVAKELTTTFARFGIRGVYAFSATAPAFVDEKLFRIFDDWVAAGHKIANHTHHHSNLNWITPSRYIEDIEQGEADIERWTRDSTKFFRFGQDARGNTPEKYQSINEYLKRNNYQTAPVGAWFYDTEFLAPHLRCINCGDAEALRLVREAYVDTAVRQLRSQLDLAKAATGKIPPMVFLMHATPLAQDCAERLLERLAACGVRFISLEQAMRDPFNHSDVGLVTNKFYNQTQQWAALKQLFLKDCPPQILEQLNTIHPLSGPTTQQMMYDIFKPIAAEVGGIFTPKEY
jgi:peptidoglycan/xylan/chitin deacetylase (PgdA/CDA1 family)